jgi:hypothetical protein
MRSEVRTFPLEKPGGSVMFDDFGFAGGCEFRSTTHCGGGGGEGAMMEVEDVWRGGGVGGNKWNSELVMVLIRGEKE